MKAGIEPRRVSFVEIHHFLCADEKQQHTQKDDNPRGVSADFFFFFFSERGAVVKEIVDLCHFISSSYNAIFEQSCWFERWLEMITGNTYKWLCFHRIWGTSSSRDDRGILGKVFLPLLGDYFILTTLQGHLHYFTISSDVLQSHTELNPDVVVSKR